MTIISFLYNVNNLILNPLIELMFAISGVYFAYGVIKFLTIKSDDKGAGRIEARNAIIWGIVGMVIMFSVFGIIHFVLGTFGITPSDTTKDFINLK